MGTHEPTSTSPPRRDSSGPASPPPSPLPAPLPLPPSPPIRLNSSRRPAARAGSAVTAVTNCGCTLPVNQRSEVRPVPASSTAAADQAVAAAAAASLSSRLCHSSIVRNSTSVVVVFFAAMVVLLLPNDCSGSARPSQRRSRGAVGLAGMHRHCAGGRDRRVRRGILPAQRAVAGSFEQHVDAGLFSPTSRGDVLYYML